MFESPGAQQLVDESIIAAGGLADGERPASAKKGSTTIPKATVTTVGPTGAEAGVASDAPESDPTEPTAPEELTAPPETSQGMVGPAVRP